MRFFFIDLENVRSAGLEGVMSLNSDDTVFIFYSENANNLAIPTLESINNSKATVKFIKINYLGANAMDFQIVSLFSAMIERNKKGSYYIISHDNGFNSAVNFCNSYFTEYDLRLGKYDNIILALTDEVKQSGNRQKNTENSQKKKNKGESADSALGQRNREPAAEAPEAVKAENTADSDKSSAASGEQKKKRRRHRGKKNHNASQTEQNTAENSDEELLLTDSSGAAENAEDMKAEGASDNDNETDNHEVSRQEGGPDVKGKHRSGRRHRGGKGGEKTADKVAGEKTVVTGNDTTSYVYNALKGVLSDSTIAIYAKGIDKAVRASKNVKELEAEFKKLYSDDEAVALFRVIKADFDEMKKLTQEN